MLYQFSSSDIDPILDQSDRRTYYPIPGMKCRGPGSQTFANANAS